MAQRDPIGVDETAALNDGPGEADPPLAEGTVVGERYRIERALGAGAMGRVYAARHVALGRLVAVKVMRAEIARDPTFAQRFLQEARTINDARHPNVVEVLDFGRDGDRLYLVMELLQGRSLRQRIESGGRMSYDELLPLVLPLLDALSFVHARGIVHRDLKPDNVFLAETDAGVVPRLLDFGIARRDSTDVRLTQTGAFVGTPAYTSPEQILGVKDVTPASDQYAMGVLVYEALSGRLPHDASSFTALVVARSTQPAVPLARHVPDLPPALVRAVMRALERDPAARFPSVAAFREALSAVERPSPGRSLDAIGTADTVASQPSTPAPRVATRPTTAKANRFWTVAAVAGVVASGAVLAWRLVGLPTSREGRDRGAVASASPAGPSRPLTCDEGAVPIAGGEFMMGSAEGDGESDERPRHRVRVSAFCMDRTEVSVAAYRACVAAGRCTAPDPHRDERGNYGTFCNWGRADSDALPINCVDWTQARTWCEWKGGRLPTEAEWEYAARGTAGRRHPWGREAPDGARVNLCGVECARYAQERGVENLAAIETWQDEHGATAPVDSLPRGATPEGLLHMVGNVWEWTADWYEDRYATQGDVTVDPGGPRDGTSRVYRGAAWVTGVAEWARATNRNKALPRSRTAFIGFRCARSAR